MNITNEQFLHAIFGEQYIYAHVTSFLDDPGNIPHDRKGICWAGRYLRDTQLQPDTNQFYTVSLFAPDDKGKSKRRKANFSAQHVIMLDDVKEKLPLSEVQKLPPPSIVIQSSLHSEQWLYVLATPCTDRNRLDNLTDQLIANGLAPNTKDPGMKGVTRYGRLPCGVNTKASRITENGGTPPRCQITEWHPERKYTLEQLAEPFNVNLDAPRREARTDGATEIPDHPVLNKITVKSILSPGRYDITCPRVEEHTGQDDSGTAVFTNDDGTIGFQCHHGSHQDKKAGDILNWIEEGNPGFKAEFKQWQIARQFGDVDFSPKNKTLKFSQFSLRGKSEEMKQEMLNEVHILKRLAIAGQHTVIYAPPNAGKTLLISWMMIESSKDGSLGEYKMIHVNADDTYPGLIDKLERFEKYGIDVIAPGHIGFKSNMFEGLIKSTCDNNEAKGMVLVLDTAKKFTSLMDKKLASEFGNLIREFVSKGGTVISLAHVNKHKDAEGKNVHAGTTDLKDDADCVYTIDVISDQNNIRTVEFTNIKSRGDVAQKTSFQYSIEKAISYQEIFDSVKMINDVSEVKRNYSKFQSSIDNAEIINVIKNLIKNGTTHKTELVQKTVKLTGISRPKIEKVLEKHTGNSFREHDYWYVSMGDKNAHIYELNELQNAPELTLTFM